MTRRHAEGLEGQWLSPEEVAELDFFKSSKRAKLKLPTLLGAAPDAKEPGIKAVVRREYAAGDVICEAGAYGSTAFLLLEGTADRDASRRRSRRRRSKAGRAARWHACSTASGAARGRRSWTRAEPEVGRDQPLREPQPRSPTRSRDDPGGRALRHRHLHQLLSPRSDRPGRHSLRRARDAALGPRHDPGCRRRGRRGLSSERHPQHAPPERAPLRAERVPARGVGGDEHAPHARIPTTSPTA